MASLASETWILRASLRKRGHFRAVTQSTITPFPSKGVSCNTSLQGPKLPAPPDMSTSRYKMGGNGGEWGKMWGNGVMWGGTGKMGGMCNRQVEK